MSLASGQLEEQRMCPACGYDLRADTMGRCPECGTVVGTGVISALPWVHRQYRGRRWGFFMTSWMVLFRPWVLVQELRWPLRRTEARHFWREAHALGTLLIAGILTLAFLMRGPRLERWILPPPAWVGLSRGAGVPSGPAYVLVEGLWCVVPLVVAAWLSLAVSEVMFRGMLWWVARRQRRAGAGWMPRRAAALGGYVAGTLPLAGVLMALEGICVVTWFDLVVDAPRFWQWVVLVTVVVVPMVAAWVVMFPTAVVLRRLGMGLVRTVLTTGAFVLLQAVVWGGMVAVTFWVLGFLAVLIWSVAS